MNRDPATSKFESKIELFNWILSESKKHKNKDEFVQYLISTIHNSSIPIPDLEYAIGALRVAIGAYLKDQQGGGAENRCSFCGKSNKEVYTILVSGESSICDECINNAMDFISHRKGVFHLRVAFFIFRVAATIGYYISYIFGAIPSFYRWVFRKRGA